MVSGRLEDGEVTFDWLVDNPSEDLSGQRLQELINCFQRLLH